MNIVSTSGRLVLVIGIGVVLAGMVAGASSDKERLLAVLATVNGTPITLMDVIEETAPLEQRLAAAEKPAELPAAVRRLRQEALDALIDRQLLLAEFAARSYRVPPQMIEDELNRLAAAHAGGSRDELAKKAQAQGITMDTLRARARDRVAVDLLVHAECSRPVQITPAQVREHFDQHREQYAEPARTLLQVLLLRRDGRLREMPPDFPERLKAELSGADEQKFTIQLRLHSDGPRNDDGRSGWLTDAELRPEFAAAIADLPVGGVAGPVAVPEGICFIRVAGRLPRQEPSLAALQEQIREELEQAERRQRYRELVARLRARAVIRNLAVPPEAQ